jgi:nickel-dependent lactate racemase
MTPDEIAEMFGAVPAGLFRVHDWRHGIQTLGEVPAEFVREASGGAVDYPWPAQVARLLTDGGHDLILSIGQVVPHEVIGMANYNKNVFVGTGGQDGINKSHFLGAAYGMEKIMGRADTPVRRVLNYASEHFAKALPLVYVHTVVGRGDDGQLHVRGLFIGDDEECFTRAAELSLQVNFEMLDAPLEKVVVYLDPSEFRSTWLGNKSIYRTRMAIADGGELIVLAPGVKEFGEDAEIDRLIRKYGYVSTPEVMTALDANDDLARNLSAAAHLIHGTSEGRFSITYCPGHLSREEVESVNYQYGDLNEMVKRYDPETLADGVNTLPDGETIFYISNPAIGLWAYRGRFDT